MFSKEINGINYERFRNLIISKMKNESYEPEGMKKVINQIVALD